MGNPVNTIMNEYLDNARKASVAAASADKQGKIATVTDQQLYGLAAARADQRGAGATSGNQYLDDMRTMHPDDLIAKYGSNVTEDIARYGTQQQNFDRDRNAYRTTTQSILDAAIGVPAAVVSGVSSMVNLAEGAISDEAGAKGAAETARFNEWTQGLQSDGLNARRRASAARMENMQSDNKAAQETGEVGGLERLAKDAFDAAAATLEDGALTSDIVAQGVGSLFIGGPMIKGFSKVGQGILKATGKTGAVGSRIVSTGSAAAGVGLQEAGGAYQQTVQEAMERLAGRTDLTDEQKWELANNAGLEAAAIQGTVAAGIGAIPGMSNLERSPLAVRNSIRNSVRDILGETLEEGVQSTTGQLAQNQAIRDYVDPNQDMLDGVGEATALGAIGGFGSAGMVQTPSLAYNSAMAPVRAVIGRGQNIRNAAEQATVAAVQTQVDAARAMEPVNMDSVQVSIDNSNLPPEVKDTARSQIDGMMSRASFNPESVIDASPALQSALDGSTDKFDALSRAMTIVEGDTTASQKLEAGMYIKNAVFENNAEVMRDLQEALVAVDESDPEFAKLDAYQTLLGNLGSHPIIQRIIQMTSEQVQQVAPEQVNAAALATAEGQETANAVVSAVASDIDSVNPAVVRTLLEHNEDDGVISPRQRKVLEAAQAVLDQQEILRANAEQNGIQNIQAVTDNMIRSRFEQEPDQGSPLAMSLKQHYQRFVSAYMGNDRAGALDALENMGFFAAHMQNKLATVNQAIQQNAYSERNPVPYQMVIPARTASQRKWVPAPFGIWVNGRAANSVRLAKRIAAEADLITNTYNNLVEQNPELNLPTIDTGVLDSSFDGSIDEVTSRYKEAANVQTTPADRSRNTGDQRTGNSERETVTEGSRESVEERRSEAEPVEDRSSRVTPEQARGISDRALQSRITSLESMIEDNKATVRDRATLAVLRTEDANRNAEATQREREEAQANAVEEPTVVEPVQETVAETVVEEAEPEVVEDVAPTLEKIYPNMAEGSMFHQLFKAKFAKSRIATDVNAADVVADALLTKQNLQRVSGSTANGYTPTVAKAYTALLNKMDGVKNAMALALTNAIGKNPKLATDANRFRWNNGKVLNFTESVDGAVQWSQPVMDKAILAALQFVITGNSVHYTKDADEIAKAIGVKPTQLTPYFVGVMNNTVPYNDAVYQLSTKIADYLGVSKNNDMPKGLVDGALNGLAIQVFDALEAQGFVQSGLINAGGKQFRYLDFRGNIPGQRNRTQLAARELIANVQAYPDALDQLVLTDPVNPVRVGEPVNTNPQTRLREDTPLTRDEKSMIRDAENTPLYANTTMATVYSALGKDNLVRIFGEYLADPENMNQNDRGSKEGKNLTVTSAFDAFEKYQSMMQEYAKDTKTPLEDVPIYFGSVITSVGRLMMIGEQNPVASKLIREFLLPTKATVDLTDPAMLDYYYLTLAQAVGVKLDKMIPAEAIQKGKDIVFSEEMGPVIEALQSIIAGNEVTETQVQLLQDRIQSPVMLHSLTDFTRFLEAQEAGTLSNFTTSVYLEADGRTNGPAGALFLYGTGDFTNDQITDFRRVGVFLGSHAGTEADPNFSGKEQLADVYEKTSQVFTQKLDGQLDVLLRGQANNGNQIKQFFNAVTQLILETDTGLTRNDEDDIVATRGAIKNPLTKFIYGAGASSIADGIANDVLTKYYGLMTEMVNGTIDMDEFNRLHEMVETLTSARMNLNNEGKYEFWKVKNRSENEARTKTFTNEEFSALSRNIREAYVNPMVEAITATMGNTLATVDTLIQASNAQQVLYTKLVNDAVRAALAEKKKADKSFHNGIFLSENELQKIKDGLSWAKPQIDEAIQSLNLSPTEAGMMREADGDRALSFAESLTGDHSVAGQVNVPGAMGVRAAPLTTINFGDARMVVLSYLLGIEKVLPVYDGMHMALDRIAQDSPKYNEAVSDAWGFNALEVFTDQFTSFVNQINQDAIVFPEDASYDVNKLSADLQSAVREINARQYAISQIAQSVDQMAATASPYLKNMETVPADEEATLKQLNDARQEFLDRDEPADVTNFELPSRLKAIAVQDEASGAFVITGSKLIENIAKLSTDKNLISLVRSLRVPDMDSYKLIFGSEKARKAYAPDLMAQSKSSTRGITDPFTNRILLNTQAMETIVHELIHAATFTSVYNAMTDGASVEQVQAVERIEALMDQFLNMDYDTKNWSDKAATAYRRLSSVIQNIQSVNEDEILNRAKAVNEFMAWTLSNQELGYVASKTKASPEIVRWTQKAWREVQKFFRAVKFWEPRNDILSNLRFNAQILTTETQAPSLSELTEKFALFHDEQGNPVMRKLLEKMAAALAGLRANPLAEQRLLAADLMGTNAWESVQNTFPMSDVEGADFATLVGALSLDIGLDGPAFARLSDIYQSVVDQLDPAKSDLLTADQFLAIVGTTDTRQGKDGITTRIPIFLALALTNPAFRDVLTTLKMPKSEAWDRSTLDSTLNSLGSKAMESLGNAVTPLNGAANAQQATDALAFQLTKNIAKQENLVDMVSNRGHGYLDKGNDWVVSNMNRLATAARGKLDKITSKEDVSKFARIPAEIGKALLAVVNEDSAEALAEGGTSMLNRSNVWRSVREAYSDVVGRTGSNANVYDLIKLVKSVVSQGREKYREQLPKIVLSKFKVAPSKAVRQSLFRGFAKADIAALRNTMNEADLYRVLGSDADMNAEIARLEGNIPSNNMKALRLQKAKQLANWMNTGEHGDFLLPNAKAVADLVGMNVTATSPEGVVQDIDSLISLYAFRDMDQVHRDNVRVMLQQEPEAMTYLLSSLQGARKDELAKTTGAAIYSGYKGYIPSEQQSGVSLIVAPDTDRQKLEKLGFRRMGDYTGSARTYRSRLDKKGYYFSPVSGSNPFTQGISQNVNETASGVDPRTGYSSGVRHAGIIFGEEAVANIMSRNASDTGREPLRPIFNENGEVIAFERTIDPDMDKLLNRNTDIADMLGAWRGRQFEEENASIFNSTLLGAVKDMYDNRKVGSNEEFVNILSEAELAKDPVLRDAVKLLSPRMIAEAESVFGEQKFLPVRRDMLNDVVGYRAASIGDMWTGISRFTPETRQKFVDMATGAFGKNVYTRLIQGERLIEGAIGDVKKTIVVRSVIVPWGNFISNLGQLLTRGVPMATLVRSMPKKIQEIQTYAKSQKDHIRIEADLLAAKGANDQRAVAIAEAKLDVIEDMQKRLSIWPLIAAGEFSSIAEDLEKADNPLATGKWLEWIESKIPDSGILRNPLRYAYLTSDTPIFKALQMSVNYGDFIAKAIHYDHMTKRKGQTSTAALTKITEEYVNYDKVRGRVRQKLESLGLLWFWNFKLRSTKVALSIIRENPVHALFYSMVPVPDVLGDIDSPLTDNIFVQTLDGSAGYSIGPGMAISGSQMNPVHQLFF